MAVSLDQAIRQAVESTLISTDEIQSEVVRVSDELRPQDGDQLMRFLVNQKKLTIFQTKQILKGRGKSLVLGNYIILDRLGKGGMGLVLKAEHRRMKRVVALKVLSDSLVNNESALKRFQREVEAVSKLEHPNIIVAHDADEASETHFLVMQYVDGIDLQLFIKQQGPLPINTAVSYALQAACGLEYAHARGVIHRDIKPANLLLDTQGTIKILDMGLARLRSKELNDDQLTDTGQILGTADYMAPEQAVDTRTADARADIYSLGATLWYLLTGQTVHEGGSVIDKLLALQSNLTPSLRAIRPEVPPALEAVIAKMINKTRELRYQTMTDVIRALERDHSNPSASASATASNGTPGSWYRTLPPNSAIHAPPAPIESNWEVESEQQELLNSAPSAHDTFATVCNRPLPKPSLASKAATDQTLSIASSAIETRSTMSSSSTTGDTKIETKLQTPPAPPPVFRVWTVVAIAAIVILAILNLSLILKG